MSGEKWGLTADPQPDETGRDRDAGLTRADVDTEGKSERYVDLGEIQMKYGDRGLGGEPHGDPKPEADRGQARNVVDLTEEDNSRQSQAETLSTDQIDSPDQEGTLATRKGGLPLKQDND